MKSLLLSTIMIAIVMSLLPTDVQAQDTAQPTITTRFVGEKGVQIEDLVSGTPGTGVLLYYRSGAAFERPSLAVRLHKEPGAQQSLAEIFDIPHDKDYVPIQLSDGAVSIDRSLIPVVTITTTGGWWVRDNKTNYNLDARINGSVYAMWGAGYDTNRKAPTSWNAKVRPDQPAVNIEIRDPQNEGAPKWEQRTRLANFSGEQYISYNYAERTCGPPQRIEQGPAPAWPFVAISGGYEQPNGALRPPIVVDWARGRVTHFSELVSVRNQNCSYSLYSIAPPEHGRVNRLNFETPFAFYDFSGEGRGYPNVILRTEHFPARDPASRGLDPRAQQGAPAPRDYTQVRYSWRNGVGDQLWDYKVEVLGFHPYDFETPIADGQYTIDAPPYEAFPRWVVERPWPVVTFVDTEGNSYRSSEGIYQWSPREVGIGYLFGWEPQRRQAFADPVVGFRGEYRFQQDTRPRLYMSPIDNRLHLLGAEGGAYRIGLDLVLRAHNLGGSHINGWTRERMPVTPGNDSTAPEGKTQVEEALYALPGHLLHAGPDGVTLQKADYTPALFEIDPPTDKASWQVFREKTAPFAAKKRDPRDLKSWLSGVAGQSQTIAGAQISDVRQMAAGFRFVLDLQPGFHAEGSRLLDLNGLAPGRYAVIYDGRLSVAPLTPPALSAALEPAALTALQPGALRVALRNDGLHDVPEARVELWATPPGRDATLVVSQTVALLAQEPISATLTWGAPYVGDWTLTPQILRPDGQREKFAPVRITVLPAPQPPAVAIVGAVVPPILWPLTVGILLVFAALAAIIFKRQTQLLTHEHADDNA